MLILYMFMFVWLELIKYNLDDCVMYEVLCWSILILTCNYRTGEINWDEESRQKKNEQQYKSFKETSGKETKGWNDSCWAQTSKQTW